jgi:hypothetical protein
MKELKQEYIYNDDARVAGPSQWQPDHCIDQSKIIVMVPLSLDCGMRVKFHITYVSDLYHPLVKCDHMFHSRRPSYPRHKDLYCFGQMPYV